jgi:xanthine dehydrogenase accessory factor
MTNAQQGRCADYLCRIINLNAKAKRTIERIREEMGKQIDLSFLYIPNALDIGGGIDSEIVISIATEIQAVLNNKPAKNLSMVSGIK